MTGVGDDSRGRSWGGPWLGVGLALAVAATIALVLADDIRYLRLGIVAALWAALVGAFLAMRYRKQAATTEETVAQAQEVYELELEREIAARREYELGIEAETRQRVEADSRAELEALRAEIGALRENLQALFGGEVLLERLSLTAQATRMRALSEEQRVVESSAGNLFPLITAGKKSDPPDRPTELIERVLDKQPARPATRTASPAPEPRRAAPESSPRRVTRSEPVPARGMTRAAGVAETKSETPEQTQIQQPVTPPPPAKKTPPAKKPLAAERTRPTVVRSERSRPSIRPALLDPQTRVEKALDADSAPTWEAEVNPPTREVPAAKLPRRPPELDLVRARESAINMPVTSPASILFTPNDTETAPSEPEKPAENPTLPEEARRLAQQVRPGGRRYRVDEESAGEPEAGGRRYRVDEESVGEPEAGGRRYRVDEEGAGEPEAGGRRRRADDEPPSWTADATTARRRAGHSRPEEEAVVEPVRAGRRAVPESDGESGSHSAGRSVTELLAAHGGDTATPRRRRRAAD